MNKALDTTKWREFRLSEVFNVECSKYHNPALYNEGNIPYIARTTFNNGVVKKIDTRDNLYPANCIVIGAESARAFYQKESFLTGNKIYRLYLKDNLNILNENLALFFCSLINKKGENYTYSNAFVSSKIEQESILLPIDSKGQIDFAFMENHIKETKEKITKLLKAYHTLKQKPKDKKADLLSLSLSLS